MTAKIIHPSVISAIATNAEQIAGDAEEGSRPRLAQAAGRPAP